MVVWPTSQLKHFCHSENDFLTGVISILKYLSQELKSLYLILKSNKMVNFLLSLKKFLYLTSNNFFTSLSLIKVARSIPPDPPPLSPTSTNKNNSSGTNICTHVRN